MIVSFLLFSVAPVVLVTFYSITKFEDAINQELSRRLTINLREISVILSDLQGNMRSRKEKMQSNPQWSFGISVGDVPLIRQLMTGSLKQESVSALTLYSREGRLLTSAFKDLSGNVRFFNPVNDAVFLHEKKIAHFQNNEELTVVESHNEKLVSLVMISTFKNANEKTIGFVEQRVQLEHEFIQRIKSRLKLEILLLDDEGKIKLSSIKDMSQGKIDLAAFSKGQTQFFKDLKIQGKPYGFLVSAIPWGESRLVMALGINKTESLSVLRSINWAFVTVVASILLLLVILVFYASSWVLKPLHELVMALQSFESQEQAVTIPVKNDTEIGLLTESFNEMSLKISQVRRDLRFKLAELEKANKELKETQSKLVQSAKMVSLGQLVAGVAHELNNPIGFIYSNMTHLKEYSEKLVSLVDIAEEKPSELKAKKEEYEYDYIVKDLPKLIASCEDGARRTRDIVLGLRNFSRLDESKLKEVNIHESLDTTLNLLQGEIKNRLKINKQYEPIPSIFCYASQINQVFMNLLSNAIQAIPGQGELWITTQPVRGIDKIGKVQISIQDSGKGMSAEVLSKVFDPFFTTKGVGQGTGLGLSISYGIIHNHG
ncbi:MAG: ATP-binding protein, partial [Bdellovibrionota bacterium]